MQRVVFLLFLAFPVFSADWKPLFNGRDFTGWTNVNCAPGTFSVRDGIIVSTGVPTGVLRTLREYENFIVELEWKHIQPGGNAGFDADYVLSLGDDAVPDLVAALAYLPPADRAAVLARLRIRQQEVGFDAATQSPLAWNLARERARAALAALPGR